jgi:hypothetical protein
MVSAGGRAGLGVDVTGKEVVTGVVVLLAVDAGAEEVFEGNDKGASFSLSLPLLLPY